MRKLLVAAADFCALALTADVQTITVRVVGVKGGWRREGSSKTPSHCCCCQQ